MTLNVLTDSFQLKLGNVVSTNYLSYYASYFDGTKMIENSASIKNTDTITIIPISTAIGTYQYLDYFLVSNLDDVAHSILLYINNNKGTAAGRILLIETVLQPGERFQYNKGLGWGSVSLRIPTDFIKDEVPSGTIDGVNTIFTIAHTPITDFRMYLNGLRLLEGLDFTMVGTTITMTNIPFPGDIFLVDYNY